MDYILMQNNSLHLSFFWHMHQPDYRGSDGVMKMPWVFLHAIKDYYEMPWLLTQHKGLKATFNITAPLIEQLDLYREPLKYDYFLSLWMLEPSKIDDESKIWLIKTCKSTQYDTMVKPLARFDELYKKETLSDAEFVDFEVVFMLSWCGNYLRQENKLVKKMLLQGCEYSQKDKVKLLKELSGFVGTILPFYASLQKKGIISLSTTPYNHPILPLLLDMNNAKYADPHTTIVENAIPLKQDAIEQIERSIALYKKTFGSAPKGFWPAEGAVDEASVSLYKEHGIQWIATDEAILFKSLKSQNKADLYKPYSYDDVTMGFRDHELSNLIGFNYRFQSAEDASEHFMGSLESICHTYENPSVFVILDGENAWEFFHNNGYDFFTQLYTKLKASSWCETLTMDEVCKLKEIPKLEQLSPGSWIYGNFNTWSGHPEKNRAWELIYNAKQEYHNYKGTLSDTVAKKIKYHFLASECSDWFWWYGDDHVTEFAFEFDALFREHLITIYRLLGTQVPSELFEPIMTKKISESFLIHPQSAINPTIDGHHSSFFEWLGCGSIDERKLYSTMDRARGPVEMIYFGHSKEFAFFAFDGEVDTLDLENSELQMIVQESGKKYTFDMGKRYSRKKVKMVVGERVELALSRSYFKDYSKVHLRFDIVQENHIVQTMPGFGSIFINFDETYTSNWFI